MKPIYLLPPILAVGIVSLWLSHQHTTLSSLEQHLSAATSSSRPSYPPASPTETPINWNQLATLSRERLPTLFDKQLLLRANARIRTMTETELLAAFDEVSTLNLDIRDLDDLREKLITALQEKNPAAALDYLNHPDRKNEHLLSNPTPDILAAWAATDPTAATAWLDRQIAGGTFDTTSLDGTNDWRSRVEAALLGVLLHTNPGNAEKRVLALPENQRYATLHQILYLAGENDQPFTGGTLSSFTSLIRTTLPPNAQSILIADLASNIVQHQTYHAADTFFQQSSATPHERETSIHQASRGKFQQLAREDRLNASELDQFRTWAASHAPDLVDQVTGRSLTAASYNGDNAFRRAADLALHYQQQGHEEVLTSFLGSASGGGNSKRQLLELAGHIQNPESKTKVIGQINGNPYLAP